MGGKVIQSIGTAQPENTPQPPVYVVDDDRGMRASLTALIGAMKMKVRPFASALDLLDEIDLIEPGVLLIDERMPELNGIDFLAKLRQQDCHWPAIIMTGHGEIPLAVRAIKLGAFDFLEKPFTDDTLEKVVRVGFDRLPTAIAKSNNMRTARKVTTLLSPRQRQIFDGVTDGLTSKEIAKEIGISHRTVESYRLDMMNKLGMRTIVELLEVKSVLQALEYDR